MIELSNALNMSSAANAGGLDGLLESTVPPCARFTGPVPGHTFNVPLLPQRPPSHAGKPHDAVLAIPQLSIALNWPPQFFRWRAQKLESVSLAHASASL